MVILLAGINLIRFIYRGENLLYILLIFDTLQ